ncbi:hypothetical protein JG687_00019484 [Phytophthora cactorum]|uniref:Uncharacterized protein n=2 Tax=Phytophthora cactorum TaxID=29920 RepID=A0A8T1JMB9_9STRA|nr:hypothetical protein Pcac1_g3111 [Phytophthora cactorum]KAG2794807.1 hypothetical protein PC111_g22430 [Phytophthora cactorum]KAG2795236.1 hypothetical protein PC112_g22717 [Phytophthora cactorum]KAG2887687.1 hypothetical protein PC117_g25098 [Phytophthora cactorum]KAG2957245.1 hypothetical protein PC118_g24114 [Phytophthora cactorum]
MAGSLANMAMDAHRSIQVQLTRDCGSDMRWAAVAEHAVNDFGHWLLQNPDEDLSKFVASTP